MPPLMALAFAPLLVKTKTLNFKVKPEAWAWLDQAAREVNQVWNFINASSEKALRPYYGKGRWLSAFDINKELLTGCGSCFDKIGSDIAQSVSTEFVARRNQFKKVRLRFRRSSGSKKSLGWVPFKGVNLSFKEKRTKSNVVLKKLSILGKRIRLFNEARLWEARKAAGKTRAGNFAQNSLGEWFLNVVVDHYCVELIPFKGNLSSVGLDPGFKETVTGSAGEQLDASRIYRSQEAKIAQLQSTGHKRQVKRIHLKVKNCRKDAHNKFVKEILDTYQFVFIGDASSRKLAKTNMAKSVYDAAWGNLKQRFLDIGNCARKRVLIINESFTTRTCSSCRALTGPTGLDMLAVRQWTCSACNTEHHRDINAALNIEQAGWQHAANLYNQQGASLFSGLLSCPGMGIRLREQEER